MWAQLHKITTKAMYIEDVRYLSFHPTHDQTWRTIPGIVACSSCELSSRIMTTQRTYAKPENLYQENDVNYPMETATIAKMTLSPLVPTSLKMYRNINTTTKILGKMTGCNTISFSLHSHGICVLIQVEGTIAQP